MTYTLIEPCAGSAAFTLHLLGAKRAIVPYQGSKWRFRHALEAKARELGFEGPPHRVILTDPGPWGIALGSVLERERRGLLIEHLERFAQQDPREVYDRLHGSLRLPTHTPAEEAEFSAQFLFLQRLAFSGKAVGIRESRWRSPGFNESSANGKPKTDRIHPVTKKRITFGPIKPQVPGLIRVLRGYDEQLVDVVVEARQDRAARLVWKRHFYGRVLVYLDPPYEGSTRYPGGTMRRPHVVDVANDYREHGAAVIVSEATPIEELQGWPSQQLYKGRDDTSPFRGKQEEWITVCPMEIDSAYGRPPARSASR